MVFFPTSWSEGIIIPIHTKGIRDKYFDSIFILHGLINNCLNNSKQLYCAFVDFRKVFHYISRDCLWYKLLQNGISGNMYDIIRNMYESVVSKVFRVLYRCTTGRMFIPIFVFYIY